MWPKQEVTTRVYMQTLQKIKKLYNVVHFTEYHQYVHNTLRFNLSASDNLQRMTALFLLMEYGSEGNLY